MNNVIRVDDVTVTARARGRPRHRGGVVKSLAGICVAVFVGFVFGAMVQNGATYGRLVNTNCGDVGGFVEDGTIYCKTPDGFEAVIW